MSRIEARLEDLGLTLPAPMHPPGNFKLVNVYGGLAYISGHPAIDGSTVLVQGVVGRDLTVEAGYEAARLRFRSSRRSNTSSEISTASRAGCGPSDTSRARRSSTTTPRS